MKNIHQLKFLLFFLFIFGLLGGFAHAQVDKACNIDSECGSSNLFCYRAVCTSKNGSSFNDYSECFSALAGEVSSPKAVCCQAFPNEIDCKATTGSGGPGGMSQQQIQNGFDSCVDTRYADETERDAIIRCCQDSDWRLAPICSATVSAPKIEMKNCNPVCEAGFSCNTLNGVCVPNSSNPNPPVNNPPATPPPAAGSTCNQGICPAGLCELNGLCLPKPSSSTDNFVGQTTLAGLLLKIIQFLLTFAGVIAVGVLVIGGFWYITSAGNEEQAEKGQKAITNAIIGLVIVILAYTIISIISATLIADKFVNVAK